MRDLDTLTSWHANWAGLRTLVLGLGVTGFAAADTLIELGAEVLVLSGPGQAERAAILAVLGGELVVQEDASALPPEVERFDPELVIVSPGYRPDHGVLAWAASRGIPIWGDIELAWRLRDKVGIPAQWLAITGTNGKTTTAQLTAHLLAAHGRRVAAVGNIGIPVLDAIRRPDGFDVLVVELSSFQLHWIPRTGPGSLQPAASVCLNVADDHLDWHGDLDAYREAKSTVYANTRLACIYNKADAVTMRMVEDADVQEGCRAVGFDLGTPGPSDLGVVDGILVDRAFHDDRQRSALELTTRGELAAAGLGAPHMVANVLAAAALARCLEVPPEIVRSALTDFTVDRHRTQQVAFADGIRWVDDSKATNPHAADAALRSFASVVWIAGGLLKGVDMSALVRAHAQRLRAAIIIGANPEPLIEAFGRHASHVPLFPVVPTEDEGVMSQAVRLAAAVARRGDVVLLAPAAASMDQFTDYADRGDRFAEAVTIALSTMTSGGAADDHHVAPLDPPGQPDA